MGQSGRRKCETEQRSEKRSNTTSLTLTIKETARSPGMQLLVAGKTKEIDSLLKPSKQMKPKPSETDFGLSASGTVR